MTKIIRCRCDHPAQDRLYGFGQRLHNWAPKRKSWRCTVCSAQSGEKLPEKKQEETK